MVSAQAREVIFVGLPGPTHNYGGLSADNVASSTHRGNRSNPKEAALQVLALVKLLWNLGVEVAILPPQLRPHLPLLRQKFSGSDEEIIALAAKEDPQLLEKASSSSAMWVANAATVTPSIDAGDGKLHLTVANLDTNLHRRIEAQDTYHTLAAIFKAVPDAVVHKPLDATKGFKDEGAANHMRLAPRHDAKGLNVFIYGTDGSASDVVTARQSLSASQAVASQHRIADSAVLFPKQNPGVIQQGVFHNDVIAVSNQALLLVHEKAYAGGYADIDTIQSAYEKLHPGSSPIMLVVNEEDLSVEEAVRTYFFNSQIVSMDGGAMAIIAPAEVKELYDGKAAQLMEKLCEDSANPIEEIYTLDLRQSMNNGGGPACLRLRVPMTEAQIAALRADVNVVADSKLVDSLENTIVNYYPEQLHGVDLADPALYHLCRNVLAELSALMKLPLL